MSLVFKCMYVAKDILCDVRESKEKRLFIEVSTPLPGTETLPGRNLAGA